MSDNTNISLSELRKQMELDRRAADENDDTYVAGGVDWASGNVGGTSTVTAVPYVSMNIPEQPVTTTPDDTLETSTIEEPVTHTEYDGPGLVLDSAPQEEVPMIRGLSPETLDAIGARLTEMDEAIERVNAENAENAKETPDENTDESEDTSYEVDDDEKDFDSKYDEAVVVIDKLGVGTIVNFTEDERRKMERAKTIKLEEVETVPVGVFATKKARNKNDISKIVKSINTVYTTQVCLPLSGYTATIKGCSAYELLGLINTTNNVLLDTKSKWSLIHSKIESTSIGEMDFDEFLFNTAASDYDTLIYGLLCATYPDDDTVSLKCPKCKKSHPHNYTVRSLIRAELMSDELKEHFGRIIDTSASLPTAVETHENSPVKQVIGIKLPCSGIIAELQVQSAYDLINNSIKSVVDEKDTDAKWRDAVVMATLIRRLIVDDPDDPNVPFEFTNTKDIAEIVFNLNTMDVRVIRNYGDKIIANMNIEYGFMKVKCPHCNKEYDSMSISPETLLFQLYRQELNTGLE